MKRITITFFCVFLFVSVVTAKPIKVYFNDFSNEEDLQGQKLCKEFDMQLALSEDFEVINTNWIDKTFYIQISTIDPTEKGAQTIYSLLIEYQKDGYPNMHVYNIMQQCNSSGIESRAETLRTVSKSVIDGFLKNYPQLTK
jgi:hypothetical protein